MRDLSRPNATFLGQTLHELTIFSQTAQSSTRSFVLLLTLFSLKQVGNDPDQESCGRLGDIKDVHKSLQSFISHAGI